MDFFQNPWIYQTLPVAWISISIRVHRISIPWSLWIFKFFLWIFKFLQTCLDHATDCDKATTKMHHSLDFSIEKNDDRGECLVVKYNLTLICFPFQAGCRTWACQTFIRNCRITILILTIDNANMFTSNYPWILKDLNVKNLKFLQIKFCFLNL